MSGDMPDKAALRRQLRRARAALTPTQRRQAVAAFTRNVLRSGLLLRYRRIGFYASMPTELDLWPLIRAAQARGRRCFLPVVPKGRGKRMVFNRVLPSSRFYKNRYGIPEVVARRFYPARTLDLVFVPLLGFDPEGNRLGMGGGYYDATLSFLRLRRVWHKPLLVGAAYECQKIERLPADSWDRPLNWVLTDKKVYRCARRR